MKHRIRESYLRYAALVLMVLIVGVGSASAYEPCNDVEFVSQKVTYLPITGTLNTNSLDPRADLAGWQVRLQGTLHFKFNEGENYIKNRPVLIYNHGHEQSRKEVCDLIQFFTDRKYVVFAPLRRGHYLDVDNNDEFTPEGGDIRSTGIHVDDYVNLCERTQAQAEDSSRPLLYINSGFCRPDQPLGTQHRRSAVELWYLDSQRIDVRDQIAYIKSLPAYSTELVNINWKLADPNSIAILGHSYGGALTVFTNAVDYGQSVAIDVAGAELSWTGDDEPYWRYDLLRAIPDQKRPIFFLQPKNAGDLSPTKELFGKSIDNLLRSRAEIFPPAPCTAKNPDDSETFPPCSNTGTTPEAKQIHGTFISRMSQIERWGPAVIEFAKRYKR